MQKMYRIELDELDLGQVLDGLEIRALAWEQTAEFHQSGKRPDDFIVEECRDAEEAERIAAHYRAIIEKILKQQSAQS